MNYASGWICILDWIFFSVVRYQNKRGMCYLSEDSLCLGDWQETTTV